MLDGGLELLPAGAAGKNDSIEAEAPVEPGATATYRYYVPARCVPWLWGLGCCLLWWVYTGADAAADWLCCALGLG